ARPVAAKLEQPTHRIVWFVREQGGNAAPGEVGDEVTVPTHECQNSITLISSGDLVLGERGDLRVDREALVVRDRARGLGEVDVDVKAARVDDGVEHEVLVFGRWQ